MRMPQVVLAVAVLVTVPVAAQQSAAPASPTLTGTESVRDSVVEVKGRVTVLVNVPAHPNGPADVQKAVPTGKRFVLRHPGDATRWNGSLVIGAHGGSRGDNFD